MCFYIWFEKSNCSNHNFFEKSVVVFDLSNKKVLSWQGTVTCRVDYALFLELDDVCTDKL